MPGEVKYTADTLGLLYHSLGLLRQGIGDAEFGLIEERICHSSAGPFAVLAVQGNAVKLKELGISIEEMPYGRLFDIDVFDAQGCQMSRSLLGLTERKCVVCSQPAVTCMRLQAHVRERDNGESQRRYNPL